MDNGRFSSGKVSLSSFTETEQFQIKMVCTLTDVLLERHGLDGESACRISIDAFDCMMDMIHELLVTEEMNKSVIIPSWLEE